MNHISGYSQKPRSFRSQCHIILFPPKPKTTSRVLSLCTKLWAPLQNASTVDSKNTGSLAKTCFFKGPGFWLICSYIYDHWILWRSWGKSALAMGMCLFVLSQFYSIGIKCVCSCPYHMSVDSSSQPLIHFQSSEDTDYKHFYRLLVHLWRSTFQRSLCSHLQTQLLWYFLAHVWKLSYVHCVFSLHQYKSVCHSPLVSHTVFLFIKKSGPDAGGKCGGVGFFVKS